MVPAVAGRAVYGDSAGTPRWRFGPDTRHYGRAPLAGVRRHVAQHAYRITDAQVQELRDVGWTDAQIAEAVYDGALFNLFVRLADAFDIHPPPLMDPDGPPGAVSRDK